MNTKNKLLYLTALYLIISFTSAIPIEPDSGTTLFPTQNSDLTSPNLPLLTPFSIATTVATAGAMFFLMNLKTDSTTYLIGPKGRELYLKSSSNEWTETSFSNNKDYLNYLHSMINKSESDRIPVRNPEGVWVLCPTVNVKKYLSMTNSARKRLKELEKQKNIYLTQFICARKRSRNSWSTRCAANAYDNTVSEIKSVKETLNILDSWTNNLPLLKLNTDYGFMFNERTYSFSNGVMKGISPQDAYRRFRTKAEEAYNEFRTSMKNTLTSLKKNIKTLGWGFVNFSINALECTYFSFRKKLNGLRNIYEKDRNGRNGSWKRYHTKLYENYFTDFRDNSKKIYAEYTSSINKQAFKILVPENVKLEIDLKKREALEKEKLDMRSKKRRWSHQLRDKARRLHRNLLKDYKRVYDLNLFKKFKEKIDDWCDKALKDAWKMKWQRTLNKAETKCKNIDQFITEGFYSFKNLIHQKAVAEITNQFNKPKEEIKAAAGDYKKTIQEQQHSTANTEGVIVSPHETQPPDPVGDLAQDTTPSQSLSNNMNPSILYTTVTPTTTGSQNSFFGGVWQWLTEEQDRTHVKGSDLFRWAGSNSLGRGALDLLLGIYVKEDGKVTTTRIDTIMNATIIAGPILRGTAAGSRLLTRLGRSFKRSCETAKSLNLSSKLSRLKTFIDDALLFTKRTKESLKQPLTKIKNTTNSKFPTLNNKIDDAIKFTNNTSDFIGRNLKVVRSQFDWISDISSKIDNVIDLAIKPYGVDQFLGVARKNNSVTRYLSNFGRLRNIDFLYGGRNASYTRFGFSGLFKANVGRLFDALIDAGRVVGGKIPKPVRNEITDFFSGIGLTNVHKKKIYNVLKGFDDAGTLRSVIYGNEVLDAAKSNVEQIDSTYADLKAEFEENMQEVSEDLIVNMEKTYDNSLIKVQKILKKLPLVGGLL